MTIPIFPTLPGLSWPIVRTPTWHTMKQESISGKETRIQLWSFPRYQYQIAFDVLRSNVNAELQSLHGFINSVGGAASPFYYDDPSDDQATAQEFGVGDGTTTEYQLVRAFGGFVEPVQSPKSGVSIYVGGTLQSSGYTISSSGIVTFVSAPSSGASLSWTGGFYWLCRFDADTVEFSNFLSNLWEAKKLTFTTVKL
jgi:uncharacterized protein (TIGR02217 family)